MSELLQHASVLGDALSMLDEAFDIFSNVLTFFLIVAIFSFALFVGAFLPLVMTTCLAIKPTEEADAGLAIFNAVFLTFFTLLTAGLGEDKYYFLTGSWHALGIGCILLAGLLFVEMVFIGVVGLYSCCIVTRRNKEKKKKQDGVRLGTFAESAMQSKM
jgi:hypothetical protein